MALVAILETIYRQRSGMIQSDRQCPDRETKWEPPKQNSEAPPHTQTYSVNVHTFNGKNTRCEECWLEPSYCSSYSKIPSTHQYRTMTGTLLPHPSHLPTKRTDTFVARIIHLRLYESLLSEAHFIPPETSTHLEATCVYQHPPLPPFDRHTIRT